MSPQRKQKLRVIISGGGTGGHIFPAVAIANYITKNIPDSDILFIGARDRMEMEKVPAAGYKIIGLPIAGFQRKWKSFFAATARTFSCANSPNIHSQI